MEYSGNNRRSHGRRSWNNNKKQSNESRRRGEHRDSFQRGDGRRSPSRPDVHLPQQVQEDMLKDQQAIKEMKQRRLVCGRCGKPITDVAMALADRGTDEPIHFDCVLDSLNASEKLQENEKIAYIGQGRFAVVNFPNANDTKNFTIVRIIEWEPKDKKYSWRDEIASVYSQVH